MAEDTDEQDAARLEQALGRIELATERSDAVARGVARRLDHMIARVQAALDQPAAAEPAPDEERLR